MEISLISAEIAHPNLIAISTAFSFSTGRTPGSPRSISQVFSFAGAPYSFLAPEKILLLVANWTCTSSPISASHAILRISPERSWSSVLPDAMTCCFDTRRRSRGWSFRCWLGQSIENQPVNHCESRKGWTKRGCQRDLRAQ